VLLTLLAMGIVFEMPAVMLVLARLRIMSSALMRPPLADLDRGAGRAGDAVARASTRSRSSSSSSAAGAVRAVVLHRGGPWNAPGVPTSPILSR
jgi:hypothetical protein